MPSPVLVMIRKIVDARRKAGHDGLVEGRRA